MRHDDTPEPKKQPKGAFRKGAKRIRDRKCLGDADYGDVMDCADGRRVVITSFVGGTPFGRELDEEGREGEFEQLDPGMACVRLRGFR